ncbi:phosphatidate cytidylyltransferase [Bacteroidales bacterium]|nr:phosphatidate cytidylyltransferase [Bacteroidales bacterium]
MKNLVLRSFTGVIYVALIIGSIFLGPYSFLCLFSIITVSCLWELSGLLQAMPSSQETQTNPKSSKGTLGPRLMACAGGLVLFVSSYLFASKTCGIGILSLYLLFVVFVLVAELYLKNDNPIQELGKLFLGQFYIALPFSLLNFLAFDPTFDPTFNLSSSYSPMFVGSLFLFIWLNDTGAYIVGVKFGRHRLFERISPKKSWEGFFGGLFFTLSCAWLVYNLIPDIAFYHWLALALIVVVLGTWGDLVESLIKRTLGVKDSGKSLPGHGGFLDRFDSVLLAVYGMFIYVNLFIRS